MPVQKKEARKVALYLVRRCCDWTLAEVAQYFKIGNYLTVNWSCRAVAREMVKEKKLRDRVEGIVACLS